MVIPLFNLLASNKVVVFDFGGVLTKETDRQTVVNFFCDTFNLSEEEFLKINKERRQLDPDSADYIKFWESYAKRNTISLPKGWQLVFLSVYKRSVCINQDMFALVDRLKQKKIKVGLLSNIDINHARLLKHIGYYKPFDPCLLSCEMGIEKPNPKAFQILINHLRIPAKDIIFIDDNSNNVKSATDLGIDAILFQSKDQLEKELSKRQLL